MWGLEISPKISQSPDLPISKSTTCLIPSPKFIPNSKNQLIEKTDKQHTTRSVRIDKS